MEALADLKVHPLLELFWEFRNFDAHVLWLGHMGVQVAVIHINNAELTPQMKMTLLSMSLMSYHERELAFMGSRISKMVNQ